MIRPIKRLPVFLFATCFSCLVIASCGNHDPEKTDPTTDTTLNKPAPDNSNATNPSLSDTNYINKDTSKRVQNGDTMSSNVPKK